MGKIQYTIRIDEGIFDKLKRISDLERRSINSQFEHFVAKQIEIYENENGIIEPLEDS